MAIYAKQVRIVPESCARMNLYPHFKRKKKCLDGKNIWWKKRRNSKEKKRKMETLVKKRNFLLIFFGPKLFLPPPPNKKKSTSIWAGRSPPNLGEVQSKGVFFWMVFP